jgi:hypothetical protein
MPEAVRRAAARATAAQDGQAAASATAGAAPAGSGAGGNLISQFLTGPQDSATPDLTKAQALAVAQAAIALLIVLGFDLPGDVKDAIVTLSVVLAASLPVSDAVVRQARAKNARGIADARLELRRAAARSASQRTTPASRAPLADHQRARIRALRNQLAKVDKPQPQPATVVSVYEIEDLDVGLPTESNGEEDDGPRGPAPAE